MYKLYKKMEIKKLFVGPLKSKEHCKYFRIINWLLVVLLGILLLTMMLVLVTSVKEFKKKVLNGHSAFLLINGILQIYVVRILHGMCLKSLV